MCVCGIILYLQRLVGLSADSHHSYMDALEWRNCFAPCKSISSICLQLLAYGAQRYMQKRWWDEMLKYWIYKRISRDIIWYTKIISLQLWYIILFTFDITPIPSNTVFLFGAGLILKIQDRTGIHCSVDPSWWSDPTGIVTRARFLSLYIPK